MDDKIFEQCTSKLIRMSEDIKDILENVLENKEEIKEEQLEAFKESLEFIYEKVNSL